MTNKDVSIPWYSKNYIKWKIPHNNQRAKRHISGNSNYNNKHCQKDTNHNPAKTRIGRRSNNNCRRYRNSLAAFKMKVKREICLIPTTRPTPNTKGKAFSVTIHIHVQTTTHNTRGEGKPLINLRQR